MSGREWIGKELDRATFEQLARGLSGSELQSLLLEVMRERTAARSPADLLRQYARDGFVRPAAVDQRVSVALDQQLFEAAAGFEAVELSPLAPLGTCSAVALTDQHRVVSALRGSEVVSDPTNVLALECALRLRTDPRCPIRLTTSQRIVRAQPVPKLPGYAPHFRLFALATGGVETRDHDFTVDEMTRQIQVMLSALDRLEQHGYSFGARRVDVLATPARAALGDRIAERLGALARRTALEHPYYSRGLRYMLWVTAPDGSELPLIDGGSFDWLSQLTSNRRAVFIASGAGSQLMVLRFRLV